jgi:hypothetical protein
VTVAFGLAGRLLTNLRPRRATLVYVLMVVAFLGVVLLTGDPPGSLRKSDEERTARGNPPQGPDTSVPGALSGGLAS